MTPSDRQPPQDASDQVMEDRQEWREWRKPDGRVAFEVSSLHDGGDAAQCPICKSIIVDARVSVKCLHRFCKGCITQWISGNRRAQGCEKNCPICRIPFNSTRDLKNDERFNKLLGTILGDVHAYKRKVEDQTAANARRIIHERQSTTPFVAASTTPPTIHPLEEPSPSPFLSIAQTARLDAPAPSHPNSSHTIRALPRCIDDEMIASIERVSKDLECNRSASPGPKDLESNRSAGMGPKDLGGNRSASGGALGGPAALADSCHSSHPVEGCRSGSRSAPVQDVHMEDLANGSRNSGPRDLGGASGNGGAVDVGRSGGAGVSQSTGRDGDESSLGCVTLEFRPEGGLARLELPCMLCQASCTVGQMQQFLCRRLGLVGPATGGGVLCLLAEPGTMLEGWHGPFLESLTVGLISEHVVNPTDDLILRYKLKDS